MVTVNSLPNFVIQTNGSAPYVLKTISYTGILKMVEIESKDDSTINIDLRDIEFEGVKIKGNSDIGLTTLEWVRWSMANQNWPVVAERPLTCADALKELYSSELQFLVNKGYVISGFVPGVIHIESMTIEGPREITEAGTYDYYIIPQPANANDYNIQVFTPGNVTPVIDPNDPFHITITVDKNNNGDFAFTAADTVSTNSATLNGHINIPSVIEDFIFDIAPDIVGYDTPTTFGVNIIGPSDAQYDLEWSIVDGDSLYGVTIEKDGPIGAVINIGSLYFPKYDDDITIKVRDKVSGIEKTVTVHAKTEARLVIEGPTEINESGFYQYHAYMKYMSQGVEKTWGKEEQIYLAEYYDGISISTSTKTRNRMTVAEGVEIDQEVILRSETGRVSAIPTLEPYVAEPYFVQVDTVVHKGLSITVVSDDPVEISVPLSRLTNPQVLMPNSNEWTDCPMYIRNLPKGSTIYLKADSCSGKDSAGYFTPFSFGEDSAGYENGRVEVHGNIMSLCGDSDSMEGNSFYGLFSDCANMLTAPELPAIVLSDSCYKMMFEQCTRLTVAPELPAMELTDSCYMLMFDLCTSLVKAPDKLPATVAADNCYQDMFAGCSNITTAPDIYIDRVVRRDSMSSMFAGCSNLSSIRVYATVWTTSAVQYWVSRVASTGTFYKPASTTIPTSHDANGIPSGWTVVNF